MKLAKNSNLILIGLSLILSLVSFTGVTNHLPREAIKTAFVIGDYNENTRFSISFKNVIKPRFNSFSEFSLHTFKEFLNYYDLKNSATFKIYIYKTLSVRADQLHTKHYSKSRYQTNYNSVVS
ncbi:hypothetical protein [Winogradskyella sp. PG-2]|uniref:hypothetical protein n=1 Tax=Winogradskyella sp. PG-2 TaxID=754409 RepID=UPI0011867806|nr:hypothetical protein [Winogradskyella sp. PG-2]